MHVFINIVNGIEILFGLVAFIGGVLLYVPFSLGFRQKYLIEKNIRLPVRMGLLASVIFGAYFLMDGIIQYNEHNSYQAFHSEKVLYLILIIIIISTVIGVMFIVQTLHELRKK
jgi:hypothetical protein